MSEKLLSLKRYKRAKSEQRTRQESRRYKMKCGTRNEGADLRDRNENKEAHRANQKWKPRPTKGSEVAGRDANQKGKEGRVYGSCDKPKGEKPVKEVEIAVTSRKWREGHCQGHSTLLLST